MALDYKIMGERLKRARIKKGYTQEELGDLINVSVAYISRIERGSTHVNLRRLNSICELLDVSEFEILEGVSDDSATYLSSEINNILKDCSSSDRELIYQIANIIKSKNGNEKPEK